LQKFKQHGVHVLGSFIFGLPTDTPATFAATVAMAMKAGVTFAQFVMMTPFPGTVDFVRWEKERIRNAAPLLTRLKGSKSAKPFSQRRRHASMIGKATSSSWMPLQ
jgi:radical SAM superfamily enzyme YgiQ (UPF0313 family)